MVDQRERFKSRVDEAGKMIEAIYGEQAPDDMESFFQDSESGRAFFVAWLTKDWPLSGPAAEAIFIKLKKHTELLSDILVKNLVMSSAMAITHQRNGNSSLESDSLKVKERSGLVLEKLMDEHIEEKLRSLKAAIIAAKSEAEVNGDDGFEAFSKFLKRWRYDISQLEEMEKSIESVSP